MRVPAWAPYSATVLSFAAGLAQKWPCHAAGWPYRRELIFGRACYSDLPVMYAARGLAEREFPYAPPHAFEYPVLTGYLADVTARLTTTATGYYLLNSAVMLACTLVAVWAVARLASSAAALLVGLSPVLAVTGTINWDLLPVMFTCLALLAWARDRPELAGLAIGLGTAAKLYPALLLFPLLLTGRWRPFARALAVAVAVWLAVNLPVLILYPQGWLAFFRLNRSRPADFGSVYYGLELLGIGPVTGLNLVAALLFAACLAAIARWAPRDVPLLAFLTVAAFLATNKVYSPQYVLWLLPLAVLAAAPLLSLALWQAAELLYWWAIWRHLAGGITPEAYSAFVFIRVAAGALLVAAVLSRRARPGPWRDVAVTASR